MALPEFDLRGIILDATRRFLVGKPEGFDFPRDPGFVPVLQLSSILGKAIPVAAGPTAPLKHPGDTALDQHQSDQAGIDLLLQIMRESPEPALISVVGSARIIAVAFNREPELMRKKTKRILLNAGATAVTRDEWNANLDTAAYVKLWRSGLPIDWYPCATERGAFDLEHERGTHWQASHDVLLKDLPSKMKSWFAYSFAGNGRGDIIRALDELGSGAVWEHILSAHRSLWSTASIIMAADRVLAHTPEGWRFLPALAAGGNTWPLTLEHVAAAVQDNGQVDWKLSANATGYRIFRRQPSREYSAAMAEALHALLRSIRC